MFDSLRMNPEADAAAPTGMQSGFRTLWRSRWRALALGLIGAGLGAAYAHFIGCHTGTCPITSNLWTASAWGGLIGVLAGWPG